MTTYGYDDSPASLAIQGSSTCTYGYEELSSAYPVPSLHACIRLLHPRRQIRLLELDPVYSRDPNTAPALHGRLHIVDLQGYQEYSALSYVWGQEDLGTSERQNRLVIHCDGHQHEARIGPNCWSALWHLSKTRGPLTIWVDSVCIDQRNSEEKAHQIPLMQAIFESAHTTYFWLGEATIGTDEAMHYLSTNLLSGSSGTTTYIFKTAISLVLRCLTFRLHPHRSALDTIFKRPWIERLWTLQEAVLSPNSIVVCGESSIPWEDLICALESIHYLCTETWTIGFEDSYMAWLNLANLARWFADTSARHSTRQHHLGQNSDKFKALHRKVYGQLRCLKLAAWIHVGITAAFFASFYMSLGFNLVIFAPSGKYFWALVPLFSTTVLVLIWVANPTRTNRELGISTNLYVNSHSIIQELRTRKATDPKDMYFGTLGILTDDSLATPESDLILYRRLCASLILRTGSLDILLLANADTEKKFPSWVIDWRLETPHIWDKPLHWINTWDPNQADFSQHWFWNGLSILRDYHRPRRLRRYRGATPNLNPFWDFRNEGEYLCVHGLHLTEISSRFAPTTTRSSTVESQSGRRTLTASRESTHVSHIDRAELSNAAFEDMVQQSEVCMFTSLVYGALSDMTEHERIQTVDRSNKLIDVLTDNRNSGRLLWEWWRRLLSSTASYQGTVWVENLLAEDKSLKRRLSAFMESLGMGGLNVVRCQRTELCTGGLGFAGGAIQEGDSVALVSGVSYPLVLRPCGQQHFKLIGPVFLPAVMDGELMDVVTPESFEEIVLV